MAGKRVCYDTAVIKNGKANICTAPQLNPLPSASEVFVGTSTMLTTGL